jgi:hypothetical protein
VPTRDIAGRFGVSVRQVQRVLRGAAWKAVFAEEAGAAGAGAAGYPGTAGDGVRP